MDCLNGKLKQIVEQLMSSSIFFYYFSSLLLWTIIFFTSANVYEDECSCHCHGSTPAKEEKISSLPSTSKVVEDTSPVELVHVAANESDIQQPTDKDKDSGMARKYTSPETGSNSCHIFIFEIQICLHMEVLSYKAVPRWWHAQGKFYWRCPLGPL